MSAATEAMPQGAGEPGGPDEVDLRQADLPPVARLATVTLALTVAGGIVMAAWYGRHVSLTLPTILASAAAAVLVVNVILLAACESSPGPSSSGCSAGHSSPIW